ncbi:MAG: hypothetical protein KF787_04345 [Phycisphaeraceae bacterium]|nr:hypothetical protein [Phycisphaerae bacterium]MBX3391857.1 hypothetical protein [Phycisphaeraceae bacterium]
MKVSPEVQTEREPVAQRRALEDAIFEAAKTRWMEAHEFGADVDTKTRTVNVGPMGEGVDYRYGFDANGNVYVWDAENGEEAPAEVTDTE